MFMSPAGMGCQFSTASAGDLFSATPGDVPPGTPVTFAGTGSSLRVDVSAVVEPDSDNDGFGDETQDQCPTDDTAQGACPVPDTTITKGPKDKTKKKTRDVRVQLIDRRRDVRVQPRRRRLRALRLARPMKVKKGKHHFEVRATAKGQTDASPATDDWKVKKKKKS